LSEVLVVLRVNFSDEDLGRGRLHAWRVLLLLLLVRIRGVVWRLHELILHLARLLLLGLRVLVLHLAWLLLLGMHLLATPWKTCGNLLLHLCIFDRRFLLDQRHEMLAQHDGHVALLSIPRSKVGKLELVALTHVVQLLDNCVVEGEVEVALRCLHRELRRQDDHDWVLHADSLHHDWSFEDEAVCLNLLAREFYKKVDKYAKMWLRQLTESLDKYFEHWESLQKDRGLLLNVSPVESQKLRVKTLSVLFKLVFF